MIGCARLPQSALRDDRNERADRQPTAYNVLGEPLEAYSMKPMTGFCRDGCCNTGREDIGSHTCAVMTATFLDFSKSRDNDLSTPMPELGSPGLKPGDRWYYLCAPRWQEAFEASEPPRVVLRATHQGALSYCSLADLKRLAVDLA